MLAGEAIVAMAASTCRILYVPWAILLVFENVVHGKKESVMFLLTPISALPLSEEGGGGGHVRFIACNNCECQ